MKRGSDIHKELTDLMIEEARENVSGEDDICRHDTKDAPAIGKGNAIFVVKG